MAKMTVAEMIEILSEFDPEAEVRLAHQPEYPFQYHVGEIVEVETGGVDEDGDEVDLGGKVESGSVVYIGEAGQVYDRPYLPGVVSYELGWR